MTELMPHCPLMPSRANKSLCHDPADHFAGCPSTPGHRHAASSGYCIESMKCKSQLFSSQSRWVIDTAMCFQLNLQQRGCKLHYGLGKHADSGLLTVLMESFRRGAPAGAGRQSSVERRGVTSQQEKPIGRIRP